MSFNKYSVLSFILFVYTITLDFYSYFVGVTLRHECSPVNLLCSGYLFVGAPKFVFAKALLFLIVYFKDTFTYSYHCFVHDSQIFNILEFFFIIWDSCYSCMSCAHDLKLCFFSIIEYDPNKLCFHHLE